MLVTVKNCKEQSWTLGSKTTTYEWLMCIRHVISSFFLRFYLFICRERKGERKGEKHQHVVASLMFPAGNLAHNPGRCPDWESNQWPFGSQAGTRSTEPHQPGPKFFKFVVIFNLQKSHILYYRNRILVFKDEETKTQILLSQL